MELCPNIRKYLHHSAQKSWCCGEYVYSTFFMPCHSCACLMGVSVLLHCCICGRTGLLPYRSEIGTFRRNLSAAACMDYTSPTTARMSEPRSGASCRAVVGISECNSYTLQRLDSLRRSDFAPYKGASQYDHIYSSEAVQRPP